MDCLNWLDWVNPFCLTRCLSKFSKTLNRYVRSNATSVLELVTQSVTLRFVELAGLAGATADVHSFDVATNTWAKYVRPPRIYNGSMVGTRQECSLKRKRIRSQRWLSKEQARESVKRPEGNA